jgi:hypothetical protein
LIVIQHWVVTGRVPFAKALGSFEPWSRVIGGILQAAGVSGFLGNLDELYETADAEGSSWREFTAAWFRQFGGAPQKVTDLEKLCEVRELMVDVRGNGNDRSRQTRLGKTLAKARDRTFGPFRILLANDDDHGGRTYKLVAADSGATDGRCGGPRTSEAERPGTQTPDTSTGCGGARTLGDVFQPDREAGTPNAAPPPDRGAAGGGGALQGAQLEFDGENVRDVPPKSVNDDPDEGCACGRSTPNVRVTSPEVLDAGLLDDDQEATDA